MPADDEPRHRLVAEEIDEEGRDDVARTIEELRHDPEKTTYATNYPSPEPSGEAPQTEMDTNHWLWPEDPLDFFLLGWTICGLFIWLWEVMVYV